MQILQGLQVLLAGADVDAQHVSRGIRRRQSIVSRVQAIVGQQLQLGLQFGAAIPFGPQHHVALLLIKRLQTRLGRRIDLPGQAWANRRQLRERQLHRGR